MFGASTFPVEQNAHGRFIYLNRDQSAHTLVLLHGMFGGLSNFDALCNQLSEQEIFIPKIPLYDIPRDELSIPLLADWLEQVLDAHSIGNPALLGNSMGGHIALEFAWRYPGKVRSLILAGSSGLLENDFGSTCPRRYDRDYIKKCASRTFYEDLVDDTIIDEILEVLQSPSRLSSLLKLARHTHTYNMEDKLPDIDHPTLLVWGRNDEITPPDVAEMFDRLLPNTRLNWIDRCGHAPMMERPVEFANYVQDFLKTVNEKTPKTETDSYETDCSHQ